MVSPPKKGFTKENGLGKRILNVASYLPLANEYNLSKEKDINGDISRRTVLSMAYLGGIILALNLTLKNAGETRQENRKIKQQYIQQVDSAYNQIIQKNCKDLGDSIRFFYNNPELQKYINIEEPSFKDKEKIIEKYK